MISTSLYFLDGTQFASGYERVVHGGRGDYVELVKDQILVTLVSHFGNKLPDEVDLSSPFYYYYLNPLGRTEKVYWQIRTVKYADYKVGYYYISPDLLLPFIEKNSRNIRSLF
jgi:hypothetical protein